jgi:hypothetical protein
MQGRASYAEVPSTASRWGRMSPSAHRTRGPEGVRDESKIPNVLLLTGHAPGAQGVGQLFLHDLVLSRSLQRIGGVVGVLSPSGGVHAEMAGAVVPDRAYPRESGEVGLPRSPPGSGAPGEGDLFHRTACIRSLRKRDPFGRRRSGLLLREGWKHLHGKEYSEYWFLLRQGPPLPPRRHPDCS